MRQEDRERLEQIEELLDKLEEDFISTYGQIRTLLDSISGELDEETEDDEDGWDLDDDDEETEELFGEVLVDLDELFGEDEEF